jgi:hypothetical protein
VLWKFCRTTPARIPTVQYVPLIGSMDDKKSVT